MASYSFDVVSDFDRQELVNTLDQVRRDVSQRYDLKDSGTEIELEEAAVVITTASDMTLQAVEDILRAKATKRNLSLKIFDFQQSETVGQATVKLKKGLSELAKKMSKMVRDEMKKVTVAIQGESLRITGKNKDDLQQAIQLLRSKKEELIANLKIIVEHNCPRLDLRNRILVQAFPGLPSANGLIADLICLDTLGWIICSCGPQILC